MNNKTSLLIDARNLLYRAIFAAKVDRRNKHHLFTAFLKQVSKCVREHSPESVHLFWDAPRSTVWRKKLYESYKDRANKSYVEDISEDLFRVTTIAKEFFKHLNCRQYSKDGMEADDLIYAAVTLLHPNKSVIVSSDSDMIQIPYVFSSCSVYDPGKNKLMEVPTINPVIQKAIVGDKSDAIVGYHNIGPKKSAVMLEKAGELENFLSNNDRSIYHRNLVLVDLSLCPKLLHNKLYCQKQLQRPVSFDGSAINDLVKKYKITGILQEYTDLVMLFKKFT
jgi:5'-3' exonuclease